MLFKGLDINCPHCRGELEQPEENEIHCRGCSRRYRVTLGIPDLRVAPDPYICLADEYAKVDKLVEAFPDHDFKSFVAFYYAHTSVVPAHHKRAYTQGLLTGVARSRAWLESWEAACAEATAASPPEPRSQAPEGGRRLLEIGCGSAPLLVAAEKYPLRAGVDIALRWLVVGKRRLADAGLDLPLVCACAEALPFREEQFERVVADSTLELLADQKKALAEARRVMAPGGRIFIATPNRFSLGPDPHTKILAGTWLPQKWTNAIILRQGGIVPFRHLLSKGALGRLLSEAGFAEVKIYLPTFAKEQSAPFSRAMRAVVALYHLFLKLPVARQLMTLVGPLFHAVAMKPPNDGEQRQ